MDGAPASNGTDAAAIAAARSQAKLERRRLVAGIMLLLIAVGIGIRFYKVDGPMIGRHSFRQTQTAFTAKVFLEEGVTLAHTPLPVFGPPWDVPFEMPIYQACVVGVVKLTGLQLDAACRVTHILFFVASVVMLYLLAVQLFGALAGGLGAVIYVWSPLTVYYSRSGLMEFAAVFFALAYAAAFIWMIRRPDRPWIAALTVLAGCGGALVKITTMAAVAPLVATAALLFVADARDPAGVAISRRAKWIAIAAISISIAVPLAVGQGWVMYADSIKTASPLTKWLTSAALKEWNYGTLAQRQAIENWLIIGRRVVEIVVPIALLACAPFILLIGRGTSRARTWSWAVLAGAVMPVAIFFNLYVVHDYYLCAISPMLALLCGAGLARSFALRQGRAIGGVLATVCAISICWEWTYVEVSYADLPRLDGRYRLGEIVRANTPADRYVVVRDNTWDPTLLYFSDRHGLMWYVPAASHPQAPVDQDYQDMMRTMGLDRISTVVTQDASDRILRNWRDVRTVGQHVGFYVIEVREPIGR